jgi:hypothetical protein
MFYGFVKNKFYLDPSPQVANERYVMADPTIIQAYDNNSNARPDTKKNLDKAAKVKIQKYRDAATDWQESSRTTITIHYFWSYITLHSQMAHGR